MKIETEEEYNKLCSEIFNMMDESFDKDSERSRLFLEMCETEKEYADAHWTIKEPTQEMIDEFRKDQML